MNGKPWTEKEIGYFKLGMEDWEIMKLTGRTARSVVKMREKVKKNIISKNEPFYSAVRIAPCTKLTQFEKLERIKFLQEKYGVRLKEGENVR